MYSLKKNKTFKNHINKFQLRNIYNNICVLFHTIYLIPWSLEVVCVRLRTSLNTSANRTTVSSRKTVD